MKFILSIFILAVVYSHDFKWNFAVFESTEIQTTMMLSLSSSTMDDIAFTADCNGNVNKPCGCYIEPVICQDMGQCDWIDNECITNNYIAGLQSEKEQNPAQSTTHHISDKNVTLFVIIWCLLGLITIFVAIICFIQKQFTIKHIPIAMHDDDIEYSGYETDVTYSGDEMLYNL
eukprot:249615_1